MVIEPNGHSSKERQTYFAFDGWADVELQRILGFIVVGRDAERRAVVWA
jgi:hypothetical protein